MSQDATPEILKLIAENRKIEAIKLYRETQHCGLSEAKEAVDALEEAHPPTRAADGAKNPLTSGESMPLAMFGVAAAILIAAVVFFKWVIDWLR